MSFENGTLTVGAPSADRVFTLDAVSVATFSIVSSASVTVQITTPAGTAVTQANASGLGIAFQQFSLPGESQATEFHTEVTFGRAGAAPAAGLYTVRVAAASPPAAGIGFLISMLPESAIRGGLAMPTAETVAGQTVVLSAFAFNGTAAITGASATATVKNGAGGTASTITLLDNGAGDDFAANDGMYSGTYTPSAGGRYVVAARIQKTTGAVSDRFQRDAQFVFEVTDRSSRLRGDYSFTTLDENGDSRADKLCIQTGLVLANAGEFLISLTLSASNGATTLSTNRLVVSEPSSTSLTMTIPASAIRALGVAGPYTVSAARLDEITAGNTVFRDQATGSLATSSAYALSSWDRPIVELLPGQTTATLVDNDADGSAERVQLSVGVNSLSAGSYLTNATLEGASSGELAAATSGVASLVAGNQTMNFQFDACKIASSSVPGPYRVRDLMVAPQTSQNASTQIEYPNLSLNYQVDALCDNCTAWANPSQCDSDHDGIGDGCVCIGDCNGNGAITANELLASFLVLRGINPVSTCASGDIDKSGDIMVAEYYKLIQLQAHYAFNPCPDGSEACIGGAPGTGGPAGNAGLQLGINDAPLQAGPNGTFSLLIGSSGPHAGAQLDIIFDSAVLSIDPTTDCGIGTGVSSSTHAAFAQLASAPAVSAGRQRLRLIVADKDGVAPVSNFTGGYLAYCNFFVKPTAPLGATQLQAERPHVCDPNGNETSAVAVGRTLTIVSSCTGCC